MKKRAVHYAGSIVWHGGSMLPGWAACCTGDRAVMIRERGHHTWIRNDVTCKSCLKMLEKQDRYLLGMSNEARSAMIRNN
jgi:hypothetical protein